MKDTDILISMLEGTTQHAIGFFTISSNEKGDYSLTFANRIGSSHSDVFLILIALKVQWVVLDYRTILVWSK